MKNLSLVIIIAASFIAVDASARGSYRAEVPNADVNNCETCHTGANGGPSWNMFGQPLKDDPGTFGAVPDWSTFCDEDFDGDGASNGEELGDPDCNFPGQAAGDYVSNPADAASKPPENNNNNGTNNGTTAGTNNGTTAGNNGTTAGNNGTTAGGNNGTTAGGNNGTTAGGNNGTTAGGNNGNTSGGNNNTNGGGDTSNGTTDDDEGCSSTGSNAGSFSMLALLGLFFFGRKRRK